MKSLKTILFLLVTSNLSAQIPNSGFENWTDMGTYSNPDSWGTLNNKWAASTIFTATQGTPASVDLYYLKLTSRTIGPTVKNGTAVSGILDSVNVVPISGFPYTGQPIALTGQWQHMIFGSSQGHITVVLTKWNTALDKRDTVAMAYKKLDWMAMNWEFFSIPFTYYSLTPPDSCIIFMQASGTYPEDNDYLWVDDLAFSGAIAAGINEDVEALNSVTVYPNPSTGDLVTISFQSISSLSVGVKLYNISGDLVLSNVYPVSSNQIQLDLGTISEGIYFLKVEEGEKIYNLKIVKQT